MAEILQFVEEREESDLDLKHLYGNDEDFKRFSEKH